MIIAQRVVTHLLLLTATTLLHLCLHSILLYLLKSSLSFGDIIGFPTFQSVLQHAVILWLWVLVIKELFVWGRVTKIKKWAVDIRKRRYSLFEGDRSENWDGGVVRDRSNIIRSLDPVGFVFHTADSDPEPPAPTCLWLTFAEGVRKTNAYILYKIPLCEQQGNGWPHRQNGDVGTPCWWLDDNWVEILDAAHLQVHILTSLWIFNNLWTSQVL